VSVLLGKGEGAFGSPIGFGTGSGPFGLATDDFNCDGRPDIAVALSGLEFTSSSEVSVLLNQSR
jgi:hypothetical protein